MARKTPNVYINEGSGGSKPVTGASTGIAAFIGCAQKGEPGVATLVKSFKEFTGIFGSYISNGWLAYAVENFFIEAGDGADCYVVRTVHYTDITDRDTNTNSVASVILKDAATTPQNALKAETLTDEASDLKVTIAAATSGTTDKFKVEIYKGSGSTAIASLDEQTNSEIDGVTLGGVKFTMITTTRPANIAKAALTGGSDGLTGITDNDYIGSQASNTGLYALDFIDENMNIVVPGITSRSVLLATASYAANKKCFQIGDEPIGLDYLEARDFKQAIGDYSSEAAIDSDFSALYYPWIYIKDPVTGGKKLFPPAAAMAGVYARVAGSRGVHKAPAGVEDGKLRCAIGVERVINDTQQAELNPNGVNVIRSFSDAGIVAWGARTTSSNASWRYINNRLHFNYIGSTLRKAFRWAVFQPNDSILWGQLKLAAESFLEREYRKGAFNDGGSGDPADAYYVNCDSKNNTRETIDLGEVHLDVGVAQSKPGEFIEIGINQWDGGSSVTES
ncbi:MAG: tail sheath protein [Sedimentibacter sp.]|jgi:phage tail sheath protein FI|nr:tail sheath protein [Sedimentibacter sp.]